ncbi:MAG: site-specific integrase [Deltaproteobacteria bacterium]|jgi:integrase|nr:site-specific integrase [Deltaproteobacteria bacterium]
MSNVHVSEIETQINQYFASQNTQALASGTKTLYRSVFEKKLVPFCRGNNIKILDETFTDHMDHFAEFNRNHGVSAHVTQSYLTITKCLFRFHGYNIKHTYKIPRQDKQAFDLKHEKRWFSGEDIAQCKTYLFPKFHTRNHLLVRLMCETGARVNEIAHIRAGDVRLSEKTILLSHSKTVPRPVFFNPETAVYMSKHLKASFPNPELDSFRYIFPSKNMIYKIIIGMLKDLGLKQKGDGRGPHTFRHYTATNLRYNLKMDLDHVARLLGDTEITISSRYLHPTASMLQSLMSKASGW